MPRHYSLGGRVSPQQQRASIFSMCAIAALMDEALALAKRLAEGPSSIAITRKLYWESPLNTYEEQLDLERSSQERAGKTEDFVEGVSAFLQKRPAVFKGK